jgi:TPR repeat protein
MSESSTRLSLLAALIVVSTGAFARPADEPAGGATAGRLLPPSVQIAWLQSSNLATRPSVVLKSQDRRFAIELTCIRESTGRTYTTLYLATPRGWVPREDKVKILTDGNESELETDGSEDGFSLSNASFDNVLGISQDIAVRLLEAREIIVQASAQRNRLPARLVFTNISRKSTSESFRARCSSLSVLAEPDANNRSSKTRASTTPQSASPLLEASSDARSKDGISARYLFDVIKAEPHRSRWATLMEQDAPSWLRRLEGPTGPSLAVTLNGTVYERFTVCRARACDEFAAEVYFWQNGSKVAVVLRERGAATVVGDVDAAIASALMGHAEKDRTAAKADTTPKPKMTDPSPGSAKVLAELSVDPASPVVRGVAAIRSNRSVEGFGMIMREAENGNPAAMANVGMMLLRGHGTPRNEDGGLDWLRRASAAGDPFAKLGLGNAWIEGLGTTLNFAKAALALRQALGTPAEPEAIGSLIELPDAGLGASATPDEAEAERRRLCARSTLFRHRTAMVSCAALLSPTVGGPEHLKVVEEALRSSSWTSNHDVSKLYVDDFFKDTDRNLRNRIAHTWEFTRHPSIVDVKAHLRNRGLSLDD